MRAAAIPTLVDSDARVLARQSYVDSVSPNLSTTATVRYRSLAVSAQVNGVGVHSFRVRGLRASEGRLFDQGDEDRAGQVAVIDQKTRTTLFARDGSPIGATLLLGTMPVRVIGVLQPSRGGDFGGSNPTVYVPYSAAAARLVGKTRLDSITVRVSDRVPSAVAQEAVTRLLTQRHRAKDFFIFNSDQVRKTIARTSTILTLLISAIAVIALLVGGIGVMNIMLVSVTERTREIGVRMAVGARRSDILQQFLIEAVLVCLIGGAIGVSLALVLGGVVALSGSGFRMVFSLPSILLAFACSTMIGVLFGFLPARNAARLDPVEALARD
jgi:macrolide transport system ATP-binding/permease protein